MPASRAAQDVEEVAAIHQHVWNAVIVQVRYHGQTPVGVCGLCDSLHAGHRTIQFSKMGFAVIEVDSDLFAVLQADQVSRAILVQIAYALNDDAVFGQSALDRAVEEVAVAVVHHDAGVAGVLIVVAALLEDKVDVAVAVQIDGKDRRFLKGREASARAKAPVARRPFRRRPPPCSRPHAPSPGCRRGRCRSGRSPAPVPR